MKRIYPVLRMLGILLYGVVLGILAGSYLVLEKQWGYPHIAFLIYAMLVPPTILINARPRKERLARQEKLKEFESRKSVAVAKVIFIVVALLFCLYMMITSFVCGMPFLGLMLSVPFAAMVLGLAFSKQIERKLKKTITRERVSSDKEENSATPVKEENNASPAKEEDSASLIQKENGESPASE